MESIHFFCAEKKLNRNSYFYIRNGHLKSCAMFIIERSEIRKKQHYFKSVHFECRMVLFSIECRKITTRRKIQQIAIPYKWGIWTPPCLINLYYSSFRHIPKKLELIPSPVSHLYYIMLTALQVLFWPQCFPALPLI